MAKIQTVDYKKMPSQAKDMETKGLELNKEFTNAYKSIQNMHSSWYGKRYNELVKGFNGMTTDINKMLTLVISEIPSSLKTIANNYAQADTGSNAGSASKASPHKISNIPTSNDVGLRFITSSVESTKSSVEKNFKNAETKMNQIESAYNKIVWKSEAATAFGNKFKKLKQSILKSIQDINKQFTKLMKQTLDDMAKAEKANTVK